MARNIGGVIAGVILAILVIMAVEFIGHQIFPPPPLDPDNPESLRTAMASASTGAMIVPLLAWFLGTLTGGVAGDRIALASWPGWVVAGIIILGAVGNFWLITHPLWMIFGGIALPLLAAWLASRVTRPVHDQP